MINLYEFLGIEPTDNVNDISKAINKAELDGKDSKLIQASKNYLLNPVRKNTHDKHFKIDAKSAKKPNDVDYAAEIVGEKLPSNEDIVDFQKIEINTIAKRKSTNSTTSIPQLAIYFAMLGFVSLCMSFYKLWFYSKSEYSFSSNVNAYVGGDAFNYMINAGQATAYAVICICFWVAAIGVVLITQKKNISDQ